LRFELKKDVPWREIMFAHKVRQNFAGRKAGADPIGKKEPARGNFYATRHPDT
jgi:hypothetical protein